MEATAEMNAAIEADAREFGLHDRQGPWRLGLLVARNVAKRPVGKPPANVSRETYGGKVSASEFAHVSGTTTKRVLLHLKAWDKAAREGWVPHSSQLSPGQELGTLLVDRLPDWSQFYESPKRKEVGVQPIAPQRGGQSKSKPENSGACIISNVEDMIAALEYDVNVLLGKRIYELNLTDLTRVEDILRDGLEKVAEYEPLEEVS